MEPLPSRSVSFIGPQILVFLQYIRRHCLGQTSKRTKSPVTHGPGYCSLRCDLAVAYPALRNFHEAELLERESRDLRRVRLGNLAWHQMDFLSHLRRSVSFRLAALCDEGR